MMKVILTVGIFFFIPFCINAQSALPPVYEITSDTAYLQMVDSTFWQKLEDKEGKWTFEEVRKEPLAGKFHMRGIKADGVDTSNVRTYWHRYRFKNAMPQDARISLSSPADFFDIYVIKQDSSVVHYRSGFLRDWDEKDGLKSAELAGAVPLVLKPGEIITVYDRRSKKHESNFRTSVRFLSTVKLEQDYISYVDSRDTIYSKLQLQEAFMLGLLFLSMVFSIFLFRVTREKVYIYFALFAFFLAINRHWNIVNAYTSWYLPAWNRYVVLIGYAWIFIPFFLVLFIRNFFDSKQSFPRWNKVLITIGWLQLTIGVLDFILRMFTRDSGNMVYPVNVFVVFLIVPLAIFITSLLYLNSTVQSYRFVAMGALPYMLFYITSSLVGTETVFWDNSSLSVSKWLGENFRLLEMITLT
jgi:two-component system, NtrC family, sensor kinase